MVIKHLADDLDLEEKKAIASYVQYGTVRLLKEWILSDCLKSPEEVKLILFIAGITIGNR
ncbi:MAG TPA: TetR-like C-terminal domain-containing protein [Lachnospiraceae bacterium]|nr:TetR-like C-terminal domain-containing protein [Lachnospiraceae bacterium]